MAILYFNGADDLANEVPTDWQNVANWWTDLACTTQASGIPTSSDNAVILATVATNSDTEPTVVNLTVEDSASLAVAVTVTGMATFNSGSANDAVVTGTATFNGTAINSATGEVVGNCTFNGTSQLLGTVTGNVTFNGEAFCDNGIINGTEHVFNDESGVNSNVITGDCTFNNSSFCWANISGSATFNDTSSCGGVVSGAATFNDYSTNGYSSAGTSTYNDFSSGPAADNATFGNDYSVVSAANFGVPGSADFTGHSYADGVYTSGPMSFADNSYGYGSPGGDTVTITGNPIVLLSPFYGTGGAFSFIRQSGINGSSILGVI